MSDAPSGDRPESPSVPPAPPHYPSPQYPPSNYPPAPPPYQPPQAPQPAQPPAGQPPYGQSPWYSPPAGDQVPGVPLPPGPPSAPPPPAPPYGGGQYPGGQYPGGQYPGGQYLGGQYGGPPYGNPPYGGGDSPFAIPPTEPQRSAGRMVVGILLAFALIVGVAGLVIGFAGGGESTGIIRSGGTTNRADSDPKDTIREDAPETEVELIGGNGGRVDEIAVAAIADLERFWAEAMPEHFDQEYEPVEGGFWAWTPGETLPDCIESGSDIEYNAYYCPMEDEVGWDDSTLIPYLLDEYGDLSVAVVFAHEWGHVIQARTGDNQASVTMEVQADCYAGAWVADALDGGSEYFDPSESALDKALAGFLELGDEPGALASDPMAHGSAFDRISAFQEGLEDGVPACASYSDITVSERLVQIPFTVDDLATGGDAPYEEIFDLIDADLNDYWTAIGPILGSSDWDPIDVGTPFRPRGDDNPRCGSDRISGETVFYCEPNRSVFYDDQSLMPDVYEAVGDFGVATLYGLEFTVGALAFYDLVPDDTDEVELLTTCLLGSWSASAMRQDRPTAQLRLSAGDFDESIQVILAEGATDKPGSGFQRVNSFRDGVMGGLNRGLEGGVDACLDR